MKDLGQLYDETGPGIYAGALWLQMRQMHGRTVAGCSQIFSKRDNVQDSKADTFKSQTYIFRIPEDEICMNAEINAERVGLASDEPQAEARVYIVSSMRHLYEVTSARCIQETYIEEETGRQYELLGRFC